VLQQWKFDLLVHFCNYYSLALKINQINQKPLAVKDKMRSKQQMIGH
jgi:hypothetical protein